MSMRSPFLIAAALSLAFTAPLRAQNNAAVVEGVDIDSDGLLQRIVVREDPQLLRQRVALAVNPALPQAVAQPAPLRKVSLVGLGRAVRRAAESGQDLPDEVRCLAGLQKVQYVFVYPDRHDVVIAGPAEGWTRDALGRAVGWKTGRPTLVLEDLVALVRTADASAGRVHVGCRIEPTQQGLARLQQVLNQTQRVRDFSRVPEILAAMKQALGRHKISVFGVPAGSHAGRVMVEADYRMKLIGINLIPPPVPDFMTFLDYAARSRAGSQKALMRWWLMPGYSALLRTHAGDAFALEGQPVKLAAELEVVQATGKRERTGRIDRPSRNYTAAFTRRYSEIAAACPVFAEIENLTDLAVVAALVFDQHLPERLAWDLSDFTTPALYALPQSTAPQEVDTVVNYRFTGTKVLTPVGGGVSIDTARLLSNLPRDDKAADTLTTHRTATRLPTKREEHWWWD